jgi:protein-disulfide isomerase
MEPLSDRTGVFGDQHVYLKGLYLLLGVLLVLGFLMVAQQVWRARNPPGERSTVMAMLQEEGAPLGPSMGSSDAPVTIYEFADFQCSACARYAATVLPVIKDQEVASGRVRYVFMHLPLEGHRHALPAARAAQCADEQGRFWAYHDLLYAEQGRWSARLATATYIFLEFAEQLLLDMTRFRACMESPKPQHTVNRARDLAYSHGIQATPTFVINGRIVEGVPSATQMQELIQKANGGAAAVP